MAQMTRSAQFIVDLELDISPIGGRISSEMYPPCTFHGWLELTAAIDALRLSALQADSKRGRNSLNRPTSSESD